MSIQLTVPEMLQVLTALKHPHSDYFRDEVLGVAELIGTLIINSISTELTMHTS